MAKQYHFVAVKYLPNSKKFNSFFNFNLLIMGFRQIFSVGEFTSKEVIDGVGRNLGKVEDLIFDPVNNNLLFVIVSAGGFLGTDLGADYLAIPYDAIQVNPNTKTVTLTIDKETVDNSPRFQMDDIYHDKHKALSKIYTYYGEPASWVSRLDEVTTDQGNDPYYSWDNRQGYEGSNELAVGKKNDPNQLSKDMDYDKLKGNK